MIQKNKKGVSWKRVLLIGLCVFLSVLLVVAVGATIAVEYMLSRFEEVKPLNTETLPADKVEQIIQQTDPTRPDYTGPTLNSGDVTFDDEPAPEIPAEGTIQILLIGQDYRAGEPGVRQRSDSMILVSINKSDKTITMTSFMRDMYVDIPGIGGDKLNACYQIGGAPLLNQCLSQNFGIQVDGNVEVDFYGFMEIVDILGGIDVELTEAEAAWLNNNGNWDVEENSYWNLKPGKNHLNGSQALAYSRIRQITDDTDTSTRFNFADFGRTSRQRKVITAIMDRIKSMGMGDIDKLIPLMDKIIEHVATDLTREQLIQYVREILPILTSAKIQNLRIPADDTFYFAYVGGKDAIVVDFGANRKILQDYLS